MFLNIRDMEVRPIIFDLTYAPGEIEFLEAGLRQRTDLKVEGRAEWLELVEEIHLKGSFSVEMESDCERCLELAVMPVQRGFDLYYRAANSPAGGGEVALKEGEVEMGFFEGQGLELLEVLREQVLLALPMQRVCEPACHGLCPSCGINRNREQCSCVSELVDERWAALKGFAVPAPSALEK